MPEYLVPGVYVEEVSFRAKTIEGVSTSIAGFIGPTRFGPVGGEPELLTRFADFERIYGGIDGLQLDGTETDNSLAHAVRAFFDNGGSKVYVTRVYREEDTGVGSPRDGRAEGGPDSPPSGIRARFPGQAREHAHRLRPQGHAAVARRGSGSRAVAAVEGRALLL